MDGATDDNTSLRVASFSCYLDTAKDNLVHRISSQNPPTKHNRQQSLTNLRVDSFSYLNKPAEKFVFNVPATLQEPAPFTFPQQPRKDGEISIFGADNYFGTKLDYSKPVKPARNGSQTKQRRAIGRRIFSGLGCRGPCFAWKPERADHDHDHETENPTVKKQQREEDHVAKMEESRTSIEVFGSKTSLKGDVAVNMERKLSMLTWDAIPKARNLPTSTVGSGTICDDMASEASSDLFEIENISGSIFHPILARDDTTSVCMSPASHYAPSEASIQWSVVTASAADYSASDYYEETSVIVTAGDAIAPKTNGIAADSGWRSRNGGLLGGQEPKGCGCGGESVV